MVPRLGLAALAAAVPLFAAPAAVVAAPQQAPAPLTGEILYYADNTDLASGAQCADDGQGTTTYTFHVDDGFAIGPYPGTFDESVSVTIGPATLGRLPFPPFDLPGENDPPIPGDIDVGLQFFDQGALVRVQSTFRIDTLDGHVEGTKTLSGVIAGPQGSGACDDFALADGDPANGFYKDVRAYDLEYEARIHTANGTYVDEGSSRLTAREGIAQVGSSTFFRFEDFLETFQSALGAPVELKPGLGCGDLNHAHERAGECRNQS